MLCYVTEVLPQLTDASFPVDWQRRSILVTPWEATKNPGKYKSLSASAPVCNPVLCPWGKKTHDETCLMKSYLGSQVDILVDQGKEDEFLLNGQLLPNNFIAAHTGKKIPVAFRLQVKASSQPSSLTTTGIMQSMKSFIRENVIRTIKVEISKIAK